MNVQQGVYVHLLFISLILLNLHSTLAMGTCWTYSQKRGKNEAVEYKLTPSLETKT